MNDPKSQIWLASYPKSGNTWVRAFLGHYLLKRKLAVEIIERVVADHGTVMRKLKYEV